MLRMVLQEILGDPCAYLSRSCCSLVQTHKGKGPTSVHCLTRGRLLERIGCILSLSSFPVGKSPYHPLFCTRSQGRFCKRTWSFDLRENVLRFTY